MVAEGVGWVLGVGLALSGSIIRCAGRPHAHASVALACRSGFRPGGRKRLPHVPRRAPLESRLRGGSRAFSRARCSLLPGLRPACSAARCCPLSEDSRSPLHTRRQQSRRESAEGVRAAWRAWPGDCPDHASSTRARSSPTSARRRRQKPRKPSGRKVGVGPGAFRRLRSVAGRAGRKA
jgi:hypothetical protein